MPGSTTDPEAITLAELDDYMGVIHDPTGDYAAGRTVFSYTEEPLEALRSRVDDSE